MRTLHTEMERWVAAAVLRYQRMVEERNAKLGERKLAGAKANQHNAFKINEPPRDFAAIVVMLRLHNSDGIYTEAALQRILDIPSTSDPAQGEGFQPAKSPVTAKRRTAPLGITTSNSWESCA